MNEIQKIVAKIIIPRNIAHIKNYIPELHDKIPELEKMLEAIDSDNLRSTEEA